LDEQSAEIIRTDETWIRAPLVMLPDAPLVPEVVPDAVVPEPVVPEPVVPEPVVPAVDDVPEPLVLAIVPVTSTFCPACCFSSLSLPSRT
jgi:hypothetical protein